MSEQILMMSLKHAHCHIIIFLAISIIFFLFLTVSTILFLMIELFDFSRQSLHCRNSLAHFLRCSSDRSSLSINQLNLC